MTTSGSGPNVMIILEMKWIRPFSRSPLQTPNTNPNFRHVIELVDRTYNSLWMLDQQDFPFIVLPLVGRYYKTDFNIKSLKVLDRQLAEVIARIPNIEIDLAVLIERLNFKLVDMSEHHASNLYSFQEKTIDDNKYKIYMRPSDNGILKKCFTVSSYAVFGPLSGHIACCFSCLDKEESDSEFYYRPVIVIRQKENYYNSFTLTIDDIFLDYMEFHCGPAMEEVVLGNRKRWKCLCADLHEAVSYFVPTLLSDPTRTWESVSTVFRLFQLYHRLGEEGGLLLLNIMTENWWIYPCKENYYYINWPEFIDAFADLISSDESMFNFVYW